MCFASILRKKFKILKTSFVIDIRKVSKIQDINKMQDENLDFVEIENNNQNARWDVLEEKNKGKNSNFLLNPRCV
jgi:hypothetical protein